MAPHHQLCASDRQLLCLQWGAAFALAGTPEEQVERLKVRAHGVEAVVSISETFTCMEPTSHTSHG